FSSRGGQTRCYRDWSSDVCSSDLKAEEDKRTISYTVGCADLWPTSKRRWSRAGSNTARPKDRAARAAMCQRSLQSFSPRAPAHPPGRPLRKDGSHARNALERVGMETLPE